MFRRLCDYSAKKKNGSVTGTLVGYMGKQSDFCYQTKDFLAANGHPANNMRKKLAQFVSASDKYLAQPGGLVFVEAPSAIVDRNNHKISSW